MFHLDVSVVPYDTLKVQTLQHKFAVLYKSPCAFNIIYLLDSISNIIAVTTLEIPHCTITEDPRIKIFSKTRISIFRNYF